MSSFGYIALILFLVNLVGITYLAVRKRKANSPKADTDFEDAITSQFPVPLSSASNPTTAASSAGATSVSSIGTVTPPQDTTTGFETVTTVLSTGEDNHPKAELGGHHMDSHTGSSHHVDTNHSHGGTHSNGEFGGSGYGGGDTGGHH
jgi:hypothetical protein